MERSFDSVLQRQLERHLSSPHSGAAEWRAFLAAVAHDFNNHLTIIFGNADLLKDRELSDDSPEIVAEILRATEAAAALTRQLRALSRQAE